MLDTECNVVPGAASLCPIVITSATLTVEEVAFPHGELEIGVGWTESASLGTLLVHPAVLPLLPLSSPTALYMCTLTFRECDNQIKVAIVPSLHDESHSLRIRSVSALRCQLLSAPSRTSRVAWRASWAAPWHTVKTRIIRLGKPSSSALWSAMQTQCTA